MDVKSKLREYIRHNNLNGVQEEIEKGCDINVVVDTVRGLTPLGLAAVHLKCEIVSVLIKAKADVNTRGTNKCSILYDVLRLSGFFQHKPMCKNIMKQLLEANALVNDFGFKDFTPLAFCCNSNRNHALLYGKMFMDYGAKLELVPFRILISDSFLYYNTLLLRRVATSRPTGVCPFVVQ